ncbi:MAG: cytochrome c oxidase subunit II, partial [uncultured bacterium]
RQWAWDPAEIKVNYGEKVILIMHNADVPHSIMIPALSVNAAIPEEGAVVTFIANKRGTFDFFCAVPCGSGHSKMQGKITVS